MISWLGLTVFLLLFDLFMWVERGKVSVCSWREFRLCLREITCCSAALNSGRFPPYSLFHLIQFLSAPSIFFLDRPRTIQISKIWIVSKNSRSKLKKNWLWTCLIQFLKKNRIGICSIQFLKNKIGSELTRSNFQKIKSALTLLNPIF